MNTRIRLNLLSGNTYCDFLTRVVILAKHLIPTNTETVTTLRHKNIQSDGANFLQALSFAFNSKVVNNIIELPKPNGGGIIQLFEAGDGLSMILFDLEWKSNVEVQTVINISGAENSLVVLSILTPKEFQVKKAHLLRCSSGLVFSTGVESLEFVMRPGAVGKAIALVISEKWVKKVCKEVEADLLLMMPFLICQNSGNMEHGGNAVFQTMAALYNHGIGHGASKFYIKAKTVSILSDMIDGFQPGNHWTHDQEITHSRMLTIEKILDEHLYKNLPSISSIAKQAVLSETTLKRNFKQIYGVSIYEYYLQKKMQLARQMLDEKPIAVKEVGYLLGYEKTSNFIKAFKKYYELSPGSFRKRKYSETGKRPDENIASEIFYNKKKIDGCSD